MKRSLFLQTIICICLIGFTLSCNKRGDFEVPCKIIHVARLSTHVGDQPYNGYFEYTSWGDPSKITWDVVATGRPNYAFKYDNRHRLTQYTGRYDGTIFDFVTNYIYDGSNKIVADTTWYFGSDINNYRQTALGWYYFQYTYDNKGRISRIDGVTDFGTHFSTVYEYDANGNLAIPGAVFDTRKNFLRTSLVLMFVTRNYSVNNFQVASSYNNKGLPTSFAGDNISLITGQNSIINQLDYDCDDNHHHH